MRYQSVLAILVASGAMIATGLSSAWGQSGSAGTVSNTSSGQETSRPREGIPTGPRNTGVHGFPNPGTGPTGASAQETLDFARSRHQDAGPATSQGITSSDSALRIRHAMGGGNSLPPPPADHSDLSAWRKQRLAARQTKSASNVAKGSNPAPTTAPAPGKPQEEKSPVVSNGPSNSMPGQRPREVKGRTRDGTDFVITHHPTTITISWKTDGGFNTWEVDYTGDSYTFRSRLDSQPSLPMDLRVLLEAAAATHAYYQDYIWQREQYAGQYEAYVNGLETTTAAPPTFSFDPSSLEPAPSFTDGNDLLLPGMDKYSAQLSLADEKLHRLQDRESAIKMAGRMRGAQTGIIAFVGINLAPLAIVGVGEALGSAGAYWLGGQIATNGPVAVTGKVAYDILTPPGTPALAVPGDFVGRAIRAVGANASKGGWFSKLPFSGQSALPRKALEGGGFARGITANEISEINRQLGGVATLTGNVSTTLANAARREGFWNKAAIIVRDIAGGHKFDDANKRTAQAVVEELVRRNGVMTGVNPEEMRKVILKVARGELREVEDIAAALRGF